MERLIVFALLKFFSLAYAESFQEISYEPDTPIFNLIYGQKYQNPTLQTSSIVNKDLPTFKEIFDENDVLEISEPPIEEVSSFQKFRNILYNIKLAFYDFVDVTLIRAFVDLGFDGMSPQKRLPVRGRSDLKLKKNENLRRLLTFLMAAIMDKQDCRYRTLCELGNLIQPVKGKSLVFVIFNSIIPKNWTKARESLKVFERGAIETNSCEVYQCSEDRPTVVERL